MPIVSKITGEPFRFWCQKVLPAVYDDSLSYYELLCKVVDYLNKVMEDDVAVVELVNQLEQDMEHYFDTLNVQEEVNNKLDAMVQSGEFQEIVGAYVDDYISEFTEEFNELKEDNQEFKDSTTATVTQYMEDTDADIAQFKSEVETDISNFESTVNNNFDSYIATINADITEYKTATTQQIMQFESEMTNNINGFKNRIENDVDAFKNTTNNRINALDYKVNIGLGDVEQSLSILSARMDTYATLPSGSVSTSADAELVDIRTTQAGVNYPSAGDAVRDQYRMLDNEFVDIFANRLIDFTPGHYYDTSLGTINRNSPTASTGWRCACVPVTPGDIITISGKAYNSPRAFTFITSDGTSLNDAPNNFDGFLCPISAPANAAYCLINDANTMRNCYVGDVQQLYRETTPYRTKVLETLVQRFHVLPFENLYDYYNVYVGHIQPANGFVNPAEIQDYHYCPMFVPVGNHTSFYTNSDGIVVFYDSNYVFMTTGSGAMSANGTITIPSGAAYARFCANRSDQENVVINYGTSLNADSKPLTFELSGMVTEDNSPVIVDINGGGDYTSLTEALYSTTKDIEVRKGTYDIVVEYRALFGNTIFSVISDSYTSIGWFRYGPYISERKVTFLNGSRVVCDLNGILTVDSSHRFSPINLGYNAEIYGLNANANKTYYLIHDDYGTNDMYYTNIISKCVLYGSGLIGHNIVGGGTRIHANVIVEDCFMDNGEGSTSETLRYHNYDNPNAEPIIHIINCRANGHISARWYGNQTTPKMYFFAHNNSTGGTIRKIAEISGETNDNVLLYKWANVENVPD